MSVIKDKNTFASGKIKSAYCKNIFRVLLRVNLLPPIKLLLVIISTLFTFTSINIHASDFMVPVKSIAQIEIDDDNRDLNYPTAVFFDPVLEEIYLINGGSNKIVVYGPDYFPRLSIGSGRGVFTPRGVTVTATGEVYVCQIKSGRNPRTRITILNAAFFVDREIFLDEIPEAENFKPRTLAVNNEGILYLAGENYRGVMVLDDEGSFLRLLQPMDQVILRGAEAALPEDDELTEGEALEFTPESEEETEPEEDPFADIPEEFRPRSSESETGGPREVLGPAKINYITIDSTGKLYLISPETGKIYVYGPDESFLFSFGIKGGSPGQMSNPRALVVDEKIGVIYVVDYMRHTILAYTMSGEYIFEFGGRGLNPTWFNFPTYLAMNDKSQLIVADLFNHRVQVLEVEKEGISYYLNPPSIEPEEEISETPETLEREEDESDGSLEEFYQTIEDERGSPEENIITEDEAIVEDEVILEEEVIEEEPSELPSSPSPFDEPLVTPE